MFKGKNSQVEDEIEKATNENNLTEDWSLIMHICDNAINYQDGAKVCLKAIIKRLHHNVPCVVLQALTLLDACVKNCDRRFLLLIASSEFTAEVRKLLGKMHPTAATKLKQLIQKWSMEEFKDDSELCIIPSLFYKLKSEGVEFPPAEKEKKPVAPVSNDPDVVSSQEEENDIIKAIEMSLKDTGRNHIADSEPLYDGASLQSKSLREPFKVRTLYDFDAAEDNELTIKAGEIVLVLDNSNVNWWKGSNHLGEGLFPANFVTEDLDYIPEDLLTAVPSTNEPVVDTTFTGEIKIDEKKMEGVINWLNETDPTAELPDPEDMLRLEDEVYKMGPLIEESLQSVDKRLIMLNTVNTTIMDAFDLFHTLSDNWSTMPPNMKHAFSAMPQGQMPPNSTQPNPLPMMYMPMPHPSQQYVVMTDHPTPATISADQSQAAIQSQGMMYSVVHPSASHYVNAPSQRSTATDQQQVPSSVSQDAPVESTSTGSDSTTNSTAVPSALSSQATAVLNPYGANNVSGYYLPSPVPIPLPYPPTQMNLPPAGVAGNVSYPVPQMAPYMPFPYYYMPSNATPVSSNSLPTTTQPPNQEGVKTSPPAVNTSSNTVLTSPTAYPTYSNNFQTMTYSIVNSGTNDQTETQELSSDSGNQVSNDAATQLALKQM